MAVTEKVITDKYAAYCGDAMEVMASLPPEKVHLSVYSPPFGGLYNYSSDPRDLSNCIDYEEFWVHYEFIVKEIHRLTMPGRMTAVHCMDIPTGNTGLDHLKDFPGDIIRLHERLGWKYVARYHVWKEPLTVRNRTMTKSLSHKAVTVDSTKCSIANADYLLIFRRSGVNPVPVAHPNGLLDYAGSTPIPGDLLKYRNWQGSQLENRYSQWIWRHYASAFWDDVRLDRVLPFKESREDEDERHVHPLQLDVIERAVVMWSNEGETVLTPFMGVGSEVYGAVINGRRGVGVELKPSYYRQARMNLEAAAAGTLSTTSRQLTMLDEEIAGSWDAPEDTELPPTDPAPAETGLVLGSGDESEEVSAGAPVDNGAPPADDSEARRLETNRKVREGRARRKAARA